MTVGIHKPTYPEYRTVQNQHEIGAIDLHVHTSLTIGRQSVMSQVISPLVYREDNPVHHSL